MMQPQCDWKPGYIDKKGRACCRCQREGCGNQLPQADPNLCDARCKSKLAGQSCRHLGNPTGETVAVKCLTCQKTQTITHYPISHCNLLGECLPTYRCTKDAISESMHSTIAVCRGCEKFEASSPIIMETDPTTTRT